MIRALSAEVAKLKHESLVWWSIATVLVGPVLSNAFAVAERSAPERTSWHQFFALGPMTMGTWYGILLFGLITSFLFGREFTQGSATAMLTAPTRREYFVVAKFLIAAVWVFVLAVLALVAQAAGATVLGLSGFSWSELWPTVGDVLTVALLIFLTQPVVAFLAVASRGVFAPMIFSAFGFTAGMIGGIAGWGDWLPWAMPTAVGGTFLSTVGISPDAELSAASWAIAVGVFIIGVVATLVWVNRADSRG
jgi:ABC-2 type transport system permease protein